MWRNTVLTSQQVLQQAELLCSSHESLMQPSRLVPVLVKGQGKSYVLLLMKSQVLTLLSELDTILFQSTRNYGASSEQTLTMLFAGNTVSLETSLDLAKLLSLSLMQMSEEQRSAWFSVQRKSENNGCE